MRGTSVGAGNSTIYKIDGRSGYIFQRISKALVLASDIGCIYASARKWDIGQRVIHKVEKNKYRRVGVVRNEVDGIVISQQVRYVFGYILRSM